MSGKNKTVYKGSYVYAETDEAGAPLAEPVFVKVTQNAGWYMTRERALELADELVAAVNAVGSKAGTSGTDGTRAVPQ